MENTLQDDGTATEPSGEMRDDPEPLVEVGDTSLQSSSVLENGETPVSLSADSDIPAAPEQQQVVEIKKENKPVSEFKKPPPPLPTYDLQQAYRILREIMYDPASKSVNWAFMDPIDTTELWDYTSKIAQPLCLRMLKDKFYNEEYQSITQFVADFRLMLENCYRYNGPDHAISKRGQKLETVLEQKLALLSRDLREKSSVEATSGKPAETDGVGYRRRGRSVAPYTSSALLNQLRQDEREREKEARRQLIQERKHKQEAYQQDLHDWEDDVFKGPLRDQMKAMWEIPQIGHFLFVANEALNVGEVVHHELELSFMLPRETSALSRVMTSLLSTPYQRSRLNQKPAMPYKVWEDKLRSRLNNWYKHLNVDRTNIPSAADKLGLDIEFFRICGLKNPMRKKKFHELTFYQRVWVVKSLCDNCLNNHESVREAIEAQPLEEQHEYFLGNDDKGNSYLHFPQFCGADLRIYRQAPIKFPSLKISKTPVKQKSPVKRVMQISRSPTPTKNARSSRNRSNKRTRRSVEPEVITPPRSRPSRLRQTIKPVIKPVTPDSTSSDDESYMSESATSTVDNSCTKDSFEQDSISDISSNASLPVRGFSRQPREGRGRPEPCRNLRGRFDSPFKEDLKGDASETQIREDNDDDAKQQGLADDTHNVDNDVGGKMSKNVESNSNTSVETMVIKKECPDDGNIETKDNETVSHNEDKWGVKMDCSSSADVLGEKQGQSGGTESMDSTNSSEIAIKREMDSNPNTSVDATDESCGQSLEVKSEPLVEAELSEVKTKGEMDSNPNTSVDAIVDSQGQSIAVEPESLDNETFSDVQIKGEMDSNPNSIGDAIVDGQGQSIAVKPESLDNETFSDAQIKGEMDSNPNSSGDAIVDSQGQSIALKPEVLDNAECSDAKIKGEIDSNSNSSGDAIVQGEPIAVKPEVLDNAESSEGTVKSDNEPKRGNNQNLPTLKQTVENTRTLQEGDGKDHLVLDSEPLSGVYKTEGNDNANANNNIVTQTDVENDSGVCASVNHEGKNNMFEPQEFKMECDEPEESGISKSGSFKMETIDSGEIEGVENDQQKMDTDDQQETMINGHCPSESTDSTGQGENKGPVTEKMDIDHTENFSESSKQSLAKTLAPKTKVEEFDGKDIKMECEGISSAMECKAEDSNSFLESKGSAPVKCEDSCFSVAAVDKCRTVDDAIPGTSASCSKVEQPEDGDNDLSDADNSSTSTIKYDNPDYDELDDMAESDDEELEKIVPEIGPFELVVTTVEDLRNLTATFAEQEPTFIGRGRKQKVIPPPPRKRCVQDLYKRMAFLLSELEPWEHKLLQASKKTIEKLRKEVDDWVDEESEQEIEDVWDSDEPVSSESESSEAEDEGEQTVENNAEIPQKIKTPKKKKQTNEEGAKGAFEEENIETDISIRGRIRKRRVIPNNVEDQGIKKKPKTVAQEISHLKMTTSTVTSTSDTSAMFKFNPNLYKLGSNHHQVIQALLAKPAAKPVMKFAPYGSSASVPPTSGAQSTLVQSNQALSQLIQNKSSVATMQPPTSSSSQKVQLINYSQLSGLPPSVLQQLFKNQNIQIRPISSGFLPAQGHPPPAMINFVIPAQPGKPMAGNITTQTGTNVNQTVQRTSAPQGYLASAKTVTDKQTLANTPMANAANSTNINANPELKIPVTTPVAHYIAGNANTLNTNQTQQGPVSTSMIGSATKTTDTNNEQTMNISASHMQSIPPKPQLINTNNIRSTQLRPELNKPQTIQQLVSAGFVKVAPQAPNVLSLDKGYLTNPVELKQFLLKTPPKRRYASNITVKSLLETKAAKTQEIRPNLPLQPGPSATLPMADGNVQPLKPDGVPNLELKPTVLASAAPFLKSSVIDSAVMAVVTEIVKTSLPTAAMNVPSPLTLPTIQKRRPVTHCTSAMRSPIPASVQLQATTNSSQSTLTSLASSQILSAATPSGGIMSTASSIGATGIQPIQASSPAGAIRLPMSQKSVLVRLVSPDGATQQGVIMLPKNLVLSPGNHQQSPAVQAILSQVQQSVSGTNAFPSAMIHPTPTSQVCPTSGQNVRMVAHHATPQQVCPTSGQNIRMAGHNVQKPTIPGAVPRTVSPVIRIPQSAVQRALLDHMAVNQTSHISNQGDVSSGGKQLHNVKSTIMTTAQKNPSTISSGNEAVAMAMPPVVSIRHQKQNANIVIPTQGLVSSRPRVASSIAPSSPSQHLNTQSPQGQLTNMASSISSTIPQSSMAPMVQISSQTKVTTLESLQGTPLVNLPMHGSQQVNAVGPLGPVDTCIKTDTHQLLLYNVGGQLVTAQGVPVTLSGGHLKTLTPAAGTILLKNTPGQIPVATSQMVQAQRGQTPESTRTLQMVNSPIIPQHTIIQSPGIQVAPSVPNTGVAVPSAGVTMGLPVQLQAASLGKVPLSAAALSAGGTQGLVNIAYPGQTLRLVQPMQVLHQNNVLRLVQPLQQVQSVQPVQQVQQGHQVQMGLPVGHILQHLPRSAVTGAVSVNNQQVLLASSAPTPTTDIHVVKTS